MPTVKLVVIGPSGVGKTSLRGKYIEGHFSSGYRATIGADFISKNVPHPQNPDETVTLQIWDTAGQERFSSLSTAFFRGADAALLMFDVNAPETMQSLRKWWADFCSKAPLADENMHEYCVVVVGNKIDVDRDMSRAGGKGKGVVSHSEALEFIDELVPPPLRPADDEEIVVLPPSVSDGSPELPYSIPQLFDPPAPSHIPPVPSSSIAIPAPRGISTSPPSLSASQHLAKARSLSRGSSRFYTGTMTTTHTTLTVYHTPTSSVFDVYESARASPEPVSESASAPSFNTPFVSAFAGAGESIGRQNMSPAPIMRARTMTMRSTGSTSSGSAPTITPSLVARERAALMNSIDTNSISTSSPLSPSPASALPSGQGRKGKNGTMPPFPPERGPRLFFTSAKTGEGVTDVFEYIAARVVQKWDYDEWVEARQMHFREASGAGTGGTDTLRLDSRRAKQRCCSS